MYGLWTQTSTPVAPPALVAPTALPAGAGAPSLGAPLAEHQHERQRQHSVDLLRQRAFHARESHAEELAKRLQSEVQETNALLEAERRAAQDLADGLRKASADRADERDREASW